MIRRWFTRLDPRYRLSKIVPVPMRSTYGVVGTVTRSNEHGPDATVDLDRHERASWWQYRGRVFAHRVVIVAMLVMAGLFLLAGAAFAQGDGGAASPGFFSDLSVAQVATAIGIFTPLLVAVIVRSTASTFVLGVMGTLAVVVNTVVSLLTGANAPSTVTIGVILSAVLPALAAHLTSYGVVYKPMGIAKAVGVKTDRLALVG